MMMIRHCSKERRIRYYFCAVQGVSLGVSPERTVNLCDAVGQIM
jgi:hypothetical protein